MGKTKVIKNVNIKDIKGDIKEKKESFRKKYDISNEFPEEYIYLILERYFLNLFKDTSKSKYQELVDNYFYNTWKEIQYLFVFKNEKYSQLISEISETNDENRKFELELLSLWMWYYLDDVKRYSKVFRKEKLYEEIIWFFWNKRINLFKEIEFNEEKWDIIVNDFNKDKFTIKWKNILEEFDRYINLIKINGLYESYKIDEENKIITIGRWYKTSLIDFFRENNHIKEFFREVEYWKEIKKIEFTKEKITYIPYFKVKWNVISKNEENLKSSIEKLNLKILKEDEDDIKGIPYVIYSEDENKYELAYFEWDEKVSITNYWIFKEKILNNPNISQSTKSILDKIIKQSIFIKWVTITWRKDKWSNTIPWFFTISQKTFEEKVRRWILSKNLEELMKWSYNWLELTLDLSNLDYLIKMAIKWDINKGIKERLRGRLLEETTLELLEVNF